MSIYFESIPSASLLRIKERIKEIRKKQKLSQSELAERSGVSFGSIKRFETTGQISMESFLKLLHVFDKLSDMDKVCLPDEDLSGVEKLFSRKKHS